MKHKFIVLFLLFGSGLFFSGTRAFAEADGYLENDGKLEIRTDRIQLTDEEKGKKKEAVSDQIDLPLFTDELEQQIAAEKKAEEEQLQKMQDSLFASESEADSTITVMKTKLFQDDYESSAKEGTTSQAAADSKSIVGIIGGAIIALAGGIYAASRNVWE